MKVLICGEGTSEVGDPNHRYDKKKGKYFGHDGWMHYFVRQLLGDDIEFDARLIRGLAVLPGRKPPSSLPAGYGQRALYAMETAEAEGCDLLVYAVDADTIVKTEWAKVRKQIIAGFKRSSVMLKAVACVPMSASESWLLCDGQAWKTIGLSQPKLLPDKPETIWGARRDPDGNHPHQYFARVCKAARVNDTSPTRWRVAELTVLDAVAQKCPVSLVAFRDDLVSQDE